MCVKLLTDVMKVDADGNYFIKKGKSYSEEGYKAKMT